jgi:hypothetical protein
MEAEIQQSGIYYHIRVGVEKATPYKLDRRETNGQYVLVGDNVERRAMFEQKDGWLALDLTDPRGQSPTVRLIREKTSDGSH